MATSQLFLFTGDILTSSQEASPAKTFQSPTPTEEGWKVNGLAFSLSLCELFASADPLTSYWKTSQKCLGGTRGELWAQYSTSFLKAGTMRNGKLYRRQAWERLTCVKGSSLLPTPTANDAKNTTLPLSQKARDSVPGALLREGVSGQLNPEFCEWLMGYPTGWTALEGAGTP